MAAVAMLLGACSLGSIVGGSPPATYDLQAPSMEKIRSARNSQLSIGIPIAIRTIDTEEILVKALDGRVSYFSGVAWGDRLPRLFQARLAQAFENSGSFRAVLTSQDRVTGDISLAIEIRDFEVETQAGGSEAVVDVYVKVVDEHGSTVVGTKRFQERTRVAGTEVTAGIQALNTTFQKVASDIVAWVSMRRGQA